MNFYTQDNCISFEEYMDAKRNLENIPLEESEKNLDLMCNMVMKSSDGEYHSFTENRLKPSNMNIDFEIISESDEPIDNP